MAYIDGHARDQVLLLPASVEDYVAADSPVRFIDAFVDDLDPGKTAVPQARINRNAADVLDGKFRDCAPVDRPSRPDASHSTALSLFYTHSVEVLEHIGNRRARESTRRNECGASVGVLVALAASGNQTLAAQRAIALVASAGAMLGDPRFVPDVALGPITVDQAIHMLWLHRPRVCGIGNPPGGVAKESTMDRCAYSCCAR